MKALTVVPGRPDSARLEELEEPPVESGSVLVATLVIGVCGTDVEIVKGLYGSPPPGQSKLVLNRELVLENNVIVGSVNANRRHYEAAAEALRRADTDWLKALITRRVPLEDWAQALQRQPHDVKTVIDFQVSLA